MPVTAVASLVVSHGRMFNTASCQGGGLGGGLARGCQLVRTQTGLGF